MSTVKTNRYLKITEDIELYLNACMQEIKNTSNDNAFMLGVFVLVEPQRLAYHQNMLIHHACKSQQHNDNEGFIQFGDDAVMPWCEP